jgi:hypothetical protein
MPLTKVNSWTRRLMPLLLAGCAGCTTVYVAGPEQRQCSRYVNLFLDRTEHAKPPSDGSQAALGNFAIAEAGQLELSNRDKQLAKEVLVICEKEGQEAYERAKRALKPWWKKIF